MSRSQTSNGFAFEFGEVAGTASGLAVPVLAGERRETLFAGAIAAGEARGFRLFEDGDWLIGLATPDLRSDLAAQTEKLYRDLLGLVAARDRRLCRVWNYVSEINADGPKGLENYRVFCRGRAQAWDAAGANKAPPAASAVGGAPGRLAVMFAAAKESARVIENPEQTPAYEYPREHGPRSPSFSRAGQVTANGRRHTFVSGTASIKGHATIASESLAGQIDCTLDNLRLISAAAGLGDSLAAGAARERHFKIYLRHAADLGAVRAELEARLLRPGDRVSWLQCDICRAALKLEIEATIVE